MPADPAAQLGRTEISRSLATRDPEEAKRLCRALLAEWDEQWINLRAGPRELSEREAHDLAVQIHDSCLTSLRDNPRTQTFWRTDLYARLWAPPPPVDLSKPISEIILSGLDSDSFHVRDAASKASAVSGL